MATARAILRRYGIRPRRRLGQNFLEDRNIMEKIIQAADLHDGDTVVEIGAGVGIMTELLADRAGKVIALEIDPDLAAVLHERLKQRDNIEIVTGDAITFDYCMAAERSATVNLKIIGNVPYYIASQILFSVIAFRSVIETAVLMVQEEVADRFVAGSGSKAYGIPSVITAMYANVFREATVAASCFYPMPKVTSVVLRLVIRKNPLISLSSDDLFQKIVKAAFSKRRKTIWNNLKSGLFGDGYSEKEVREALASAGIGGGRRGETLSAEEYGVLSNILFSSRYRKNHLDKDLRPC